MHPLNCFLIYSLVTLNLLSVAVCGDRTLKTSAAPPVAADWPAWRGPDGNGIAPGRARPPLQWTNEKNVVWKVPVPGRSHGSPIVCSGQIFVTAADTEAKQQLVICIDQRRGQELWRRVVHSGGFTQKWNEKASFASSTPACDGDLVYVTFFNADAVFASALTLSGELVWQTKICNYKVHQGYGASPMLYHDLVIVAADNKSGGAVAGLDRRTGAIVWKHDRPAKPNYVSPVLVKASGREQLVMTGCNLVTSLKPNDGGLVWETPGATTECVTSTVTDGQRVFTSGGYPDNHISAVMADGSGKTAWRNKMRVYVPSMLVRNGMLYAVQDAGIAVCLRTSDGELMWKKRLSGTFSSSLVMIDDRIYATSESGHTYIYQATPDGYRELGHNVLGDSVFASMAISGGRIYHRAAYTVDDRRQEYIHCIGH